MAYEVLCKCKNRFLVSHSVVWRLLVCPDCGRSIWYERDLSGKVRTTVPVGRFKSNKERERRLNALAKETCPDLLNKQKPTKAKKPSRISS